MAGAIDLAGAGGRRSATVRTEYEFRNTKSVTTAQSETSIRRASRRRGISESAPIGRLTPHQPWALSQ